MEKRMNNKIGLITFHRSTNFGSCLQAFALYKKIEMMGYQCEIIDYRCPAIEERENLMTPRISLFNPKTVYRRVFVWPTLKKKSDNLEKFLENHAKIGKEYYPNTISLVNENYGKFLVGSDIVWGRDITNNDYTYFLDFVLDGHKKYAFSSSVGDYSIRGDEEKIGEMLKSFSRIAVREKEAVQWVNNLSGKEAEWVCDPTMLLTAEEWIEFIPPTKFHDNYVLVYFDSPDHKCLKDAIKYGKEHNKKVFHIDYYRKQMSDVIQKKPTTLNEFLGLIKNANRIFTASYHGMLFSIYFEKQFVFYTRAHKSRVLSLAEKLGILEQCGDANDTVSHLNYKKVTDKVINFRNQSIKSLMEILSDEV